MTVHHARLAVLNAALDAAIDHRVQLHRLSGDKDISVPAYLAGLEAVRDVEAALEPLRHEAGAQHSRAYELAQEEVAAGTKGCER